MSIYLPEISTRTIKVFFSSISDAFLIPLKQLPRVLFHGLILATIICGFWLLDSLKDPILTKFVGIEYQPVAKFCSVVTTLIVVCLYDFSTSIFSKQTLFHIIASIFGMLVLIMAAELGDPETGLSSSKNSAIDKGPHRIIGWVCYFTIEAYGSLMVALFWSFTNSIMNLEEAKGAYGLIISIAQIGAMIGSTLATNATEIGIPQLFLVGSMAIFLVSILIKLYSLVFRDEAIEAVVQRVLSSSQDESDVVAPTASDKGEGSSKTSSFLAYSRDICAGFYEGLTLIMTYRYVQYLLGISCLYEIAITVLDYEFKLLGADSITRSAAVASPSEIYDAATDSNRFANLLGHFGQLTNFLSFIISFFGFSFLVHRIGVRYTLVVFPTILFVSVVITNLAPSFWVLFITVSVLKALIFSLNEPVKELLYIPTSDQIKFKAKAWIDVFGSRLAKGIGSAITAMAAGNLNRLRNISELPCLAVALLMIVLSWTLGTEFLRLIKENIIIGGGSSAGGKDGDELLPDRNGLHPGDVGYDGYDLHLFEGVFEDDETVGSGEIDMKKYPILNNV